MSFVKVQKKGQVTLPPHLRSQVGLADGDLLKASVQRGKIILTPAAGRGVKDDEYTAAQRRLIDARLAKADEDLKKGRTFGPFDTADEMIASIKEQLKKRAKASAMANRPSNL